MDKNLDIFQANPDISVTKALKQIEEANGKILFVIDSKKRLMGSLTDGDIRRWILNNGSLTSSIRKIYNKNPLFLKGDYDIEGTKKLMIKKKVESIPVVNKDRSIQDILFWKDIFSGKFYKVKPHLKVPVVIMAGGQGSRLAPLTKILPKALIPLGDKPIAEVIIERFSEYGSRDFYLIVNYKSGMIKSYFDSNHRPYRIHYIEEKEPLGTAGGLRLLPEIKEDSFLLTNCDVLINVDYDKVYEFHKKAKHDITLIGSVRNFVIPYGIVKVKSDGVVSRIVEKPEYHFMANAGMYIIQKRILKMIPKKEGIDMNNLINVAKTKGASIGVYPVSEKAWTDVGQWDEYHNILNNM